LIKHLRLVLGLATVTVAMMTAFAAPAMAADNNRHENRVDNRFDNRLERLDNRFEFDGGGLLASDLDLSPVFVTGEDLADELCSPLSSDVINNAIPGCIFSDDNDALDFVSGVEFDTVDFHHDIFDNDDFDPLSFVSDIDDVDFVDVDLDWGSPFVDRDNHNGNARHNGNGRHDGNNHHGGGGSKGR
jgi:hypothetical protein